MTGQDRDGRAPLKPRERLASSSAEPSRPPRAATRPRPRKRRWLGRIAGLLLALLLAGGTVGGVIAWQVYERFAAGLPTIDGLKHYQPPVMTRVYADNSQLMAEFATQRRLFVPIALVPPLVKQAFISAEDRNFWTHHGIDPPAILRAALRDLAHLGQGKRPEGASTITQQLAKNMLVGNELSLSRKIREAILAVRIDQTLSKDRVLELYLNEIYLGLGSYGIAAAAQTYFNKSLDQLTLPEAAFLAALPKAPNNYNPFRFPDAARARRDFVLDRMREDGAITPAQAQEAKAAPLVPAASARPDTVHGGEWFTEEVRRLLTARYGADATMGGGLTIHTSLDPALQREADTALRQGLEAYDRSHTGWRGPVTHLTAPGLATNWATQLAAVPRAPGQLPDWRLGVVLEAGGPTAKIGWLDGPADQPASDTPRVSQLLLRDLAWARPARPGGTYGPSPRKVSDVLAAGDVVMVEPPSDPSKPLSLHQVPQVEGALVAIDPATGRVLALSGGWSYDLSQFDRATQAQRQPGSSFKPFVYLTALEQGISPSQRVLDEPFVLDMGAQGQWRPNNYERNFNGPTPLRIALERSLNLVTIRLAQKIGMDAVAKTAEAFHVVDKMPKVLPAALGAVETTVLRQAAAYAGLSTGGRAVLPSFVDSVQDQEGNVIYRAPGLACQCADPAQPPAITDQRPQIADPQSTFQLITMMQGVVTRGTGFGAGAGLGRAIAGKTGTTQNFNDSWFVGFTPDLSIAVWVGKDDDTSLGDKMTGAALAVPIWHQFAAAALANRPKLQFPVPDGVQLLAWDSGFGQVTDAFKTGQQPGASDGLIGGTGGQADPGLTASSGDLTVGVDSGMGGLY